MPKSADPGRSSANRIFAVLSAFEQSGKALALRDVSTATTIPLATVYRISRELLQGGVLERNANKELQTGLRPWELGSLAARQRRLRRIARPVMESLYESTDQTVQLGLAVNHRAVCVEKISGRRSVRNITEIGRHRYTPSTIAPWDGLQLEVEKVRRERVAYCRDEVTTGTSSVACPIFDDDRKFVAAVGIPTATPQNVARFESPARQTAEIISRKLAYGLIRSSPTADRYPMSR
jgi:DNA-binding IclR family transcriptional regulator